MKLEQKVFKEKAIALAQALKGLGYPVQVANDRFETWFRYTNILTREVMYVYNSEDGVLFTGHLDLTTRIKESSDFLEVI